MNLDSEVGQMTCGASLFTFLTEVDNYDAFHSSGSALCFLHVDNGLVFADRVLQRAVGFGDIVEKRICGGISQPSRTQ